MTLAVLGLFLAAAISCGPRKGSPGRGGPGSSVSRDSADGPPALFQFDLVCERVPDTMLLGLLERDSILVIDFEAEGTGGPVLVRAACTRERFAGVFRALTVIRRVATSSGDGFCDLEYLEGYSIPEKYRPFVFEVRLPDPQAE
jgi:hypothetical protein